MTDHLRERTPQRTGTVTSHGDTAELTLVRTVPQDSIAVWPYLAESRELGTWFGTYTGDPDDGVVTLSMTAEEEGGSSEVRILQCRPPELLAVRSSDEHGSWNLEIELIDGGSEQGSGTEIRFTHHDVPLAGLPDIGPGWEWYLDRLVAAVDERACPEWDDYYPALRDAYVE